MQLATRLTLDKPVTLRLPMLMPESILSGDIALLSAEF